MSIKQRRSGANMMRLSQVTQGSYVLNDKTSNNIEPVTGGIVVADEDTSMSSIKCHSIGISNDVMIRNDGSIVDDHERSDRIGTKIETFL
jgi:hypothetical protein